MTSRHNRRLNERLRQLESNPLCEVQAADHTSEYQDPDTINGRRPDIVASCGPMTVVEEVEAAGDDSTHAQAQNDAFESFAQSSPFRNFDVVEYGRSDQSTSGGSDPFDIDLW